jgi:hypothetical protein
MARILFVYAFTGVAVLVDAAVKAGTVSNVALSGAIQTSRLTLFDYAFSIMRRPDVAPPVARRPPKCPARAAAG